MKIIYLNNQLSDKKIFYHKTKQFTQIESTEVFVIHLVTTIEIRILQDFIRFMQFKNRL